MKPYVTTETLEEKTQQWLERIAPFNQHKMELDTEHACLLVIDMQEFFLDPNSPTYTCGGATILPNVKKLVEGFRKVNRPIIYTKHVHHPDKLDVGIMGWWWEGMCKEGSPESDIVKELYPLPSEKIVLKHRYSSFYNTDLEVVLRCLGIKDVVITGIMTCMCCESTARDAYYRDYRVFFPADGTGAINEEMHLASLLNLGFGFAYITTVKDILSQLKEL